jgi:hypothetical protein
LQIPHANGNQELAALTNKNRENYDKIHADNLVRRSGVRIYRKKNKKIKHFEEKASDKI